MKIICPKHKGLIEVPDQDIADASNRSSKELIFNCSVCQEVVMIDNIRIEKKVKRIRRYN